MGDVQGKEDSEAFRCIKIIFRRKQFHFPGGSKHCCWSCAMPKKKNPKHKAATSGFPDRTQTYEMYKLRQWITPSTYPACKNFLQTSMNCFKTR